MTIYMKLDFIRETQSVWERRAPLAPQHVRKLVKKGVKVIQWMFVILCRYFYCQYNFFRDADSVSHMVIAMAILCLRHFFLFDI